MKVIILGGLWGILSAVMGYSVTTVKGFLVFLLGWVIMMILFSKKD